MKTKFKELLAKLVEKFKSLFKRKEKPVVAISDPVATPVTPTPVEAPTEPHVVTNADKFGRGTASFLGLDPDAPYVAGVATTTTPAPSPTQDKTGFDLANSNGNWLKNTLEAGITRFHFEVRDGQRHVEVTFCQSFDLGGFNYSGSVIKDDGTLVESIADTGLQGNALVKLLDFVPPVAQRGDGKPGIGRAWPHGSGRFHIDLYVSRKQEYVIQYNHD